MLRSWIDVCRKTHGQCLKSARGYLMETSKEPTLPSRVLGLGTGPPHQVRLIESQCRRGHYATLSHCWGQSGKVRIKTTKGNYLSHLRCINEMSLSKTFQDAITVTREVDLRYLWIDSLCIVQDDHDDWVKEAGNMGDHYEQSYLTIAACSSDADSDGLFSKWQRSSKLIAVPYFDRYGIRQGQFSVTATTRKHRSALNDRAWAAQEQILSRKMISYYDDGLVWNCREISTTDCGLNTTQLGYDISDWSWFLTHYTNRKLTFTKDRLAAIQGLVNVLKTERKDEYIAGFWTNDMPMQLLWTSDEILSADTGLSSFPSWSWASKLGKIEFFRHWQRPWAWRPCCQILGAKPGETLILQGTVLTSTSLYFKRFWDLSPTYMLGHQDDKSMVDWADGMDDFYLPNWPPNHMLVMLGQYGKVCGWMTLDCCTYPGTPPYLLLVAVSIHIYHPRVGLVLALQPSECGTFQRKGMGLVGSWLFDQLSSRPHSEITLV